MMGRLSVGPDGWLRYEKHQGPYIVAVAPCGTKREMVPEYIAQREKLRNSVNPMAEGRTEVSPNWFFGA